MKLNEFKSIGPNLAKILEADGWTLDMLKNADLSELTKYKGIGKQTAQRIVQEAKNAGISQSLSPKEQAKNLVEAGRFSWSDLALATVRHVSSYTSGEVMAASIISAAQKEVNARGLRESRAYLPGGGAVSMSPYLETNAAFPEEWLSGKVSPPPMGVRVKRIFDKAVEFYNA